LAPGRPRRSLKNLLREAGVPPWLRSRLPLLYVEDRLAWVAGIGADAHCLAGAGEPGWVISWQRPS
jgi:tRNA(Ile)-lysidine synthase